MSCFGASVGPLHERVTPHKISHVGGNSISGASTKKELTLSWPGYLRPSMADDLHYDQVEQKPYNTQVQ